MGVVPGYTGRVAEVMRGRWLIRSSMVGVKPRRWSWGRGRDEGGWPVGGARWMCEGWMETVLERRV